MDLPWMLLKQSRFRYVCIALLFLFCSKLSYAQLVPGFRANGLIVNQGDTITICIGSSVTYQSTAQGNSAINWRFNRGNPATNTGNSPTINYATAGIDTTWQFISAGTTHDSMFILVRVNSVKPAAGYNFTPDAECGNVAVQFTGTSSGNGLSYLWSFGDGSTSTLQNPSYQFLNAIGQSGTQFYDVKLVVSNDQVCRDSITKRVTIRRVPDASIGNGRSPEVVFGPFNNEQTFRRCENTPFYEFRFTNATTTSAIITQYKVEWGDGKDSTFATWPAATTISHTFPRGKSIMKVTVQGNNGCIGIKTYNVFLGTTPAGSLGNIGNNSICVPNALIFPVNDYANNAPGTTYRFSVTDGSTFQSFQHPPPASVSHTFTTGSCGNVSNGYTNAFAANLFIENPCGSTTSFIVPIYASGKPRALISFSPSNNTCTNTPVIISNASNFGGLITPTGGTGSTCSNVGKQVWAISPSTGYTFTGTLGSTQGNVLNGAVWTAGSPSLNARFTAPGTYTVKLYIANEQCGIDSTERTICVRQPAVASFTMNKREACAPDTLIVNNTTPLGGCIGDTYSWSLQYADPAGCNSTSSFAYVNGTSSASRSPQIRFINPGRYIVVLNVSAAGCISTTARDTFYVKGRPAVALPAPAATCIGNSIIPTATVSNCYSSTQPTFLWTFTNGSPATFTGPVPPAITFGPVGLHSVKLEVTNECGTTIPAVVNANITAAPNANAGTDKLTCSGIGVQIGAAPAGGFIYTWLPATGLSSAAAANPTLTLSYNGPAADTTYQYVVRASSGANCADTDTVMVTIRRRPVVTVSPLASAVCAGGNAVLTASGATTYLWTPSTGLNTTTADVVTATPSATTVYTVTGTTNGCTATAQATVTITASGANVDAGRDSVICNTTAGVQFIGTPLGGTWSGGLFITPAGLFNPVAAGKGSFKLYYSVGSGACSKTDSLTATVTDAPVSSAGNDTTICQSTGTISFKGVPAGGTWSGSPLITANGNFNTGTPGIYNLIYTLGSGSCVVRDTVQLTVIAGGTNNNISSNQSICTGAIPALLTGTSGGNGSTYQWQSATDSITWINIPGATQINYAPPSLSVTTFFRRIMYGNLCGGAPSNNSVPVKVTIGTGVQAVFNPTKTEDCGPFTINSSIINLTPFNDRISEYRWFANNRFLGSGQIFPGYILTGTENSVIIKLVAISRSGCGNDSTAHEFFRLENPVVDAGAGGPVVSGATVQLNATITNGTATQYLWTPAAGLSCTNCPNPTATISGSIVYKVDVRNARGCTGSDTIGYTTACTSAQVFIPNAFSPDGDGINDVLMVRANGIARIKYFRIFNRWGQLVFERVNINANNPLQGWDGRVNGKIVQDVYVYTAEALCSGGETFSYRGNVSLMIMR